MPSSRGHEADARSTRQVAAEAGGTQTLARPASRKSAGLPRRSVIAAGALLAIGIALPALAADPNSKTAAADKARLAKIAASGTKEERLDAIARLSHVATPESADWIVKAAFDRTAEEEVRIAGIAVLYQIGADPAVARHLVSIAQRDLQKPNGEYLLVAALGVEDPNTTAPLRDFLDKEGAKKKPVYTRCCKAAELAGQVNEAAHKAQEEPTGNSVEALKNLCRLSLFSDGPKYEKSASTLRRAVTKGLISCHQPPAVDALFEIAPTLLEKPHLDAELDTFAYFHEISGEFLGSDLAAWKQWWEGEGREQPLHPRRVDREDKLLGKKRVVVMYEHWVAPSPRVCELMPRVIRNTIRDIPDGSDFCIFGSGYIFGNAISIEGGKATAETKSRAVARLFDADDFLVWCENVQEGTFRSKRKGEGPNLRSTYESFAHVLTTLRPTEIIYIHRDGPGSPFEDYSAKRLEGFRTTQFFGRKRTVRLITGANRHHQLGGVSIRVISGFPDPTQQHEGNLLARGNWGNYFHHGVQADLFNP